VTLQTCFQWKTAVNFFRKEIFTKIQLRICGKFYNIVFIKAINFGRKKLVEIANIVVKALTPVLSLCISADKFLAHQYISLEFF
jgi:hypothetical protein